MDYSSPIWRVQSAPGNNTVVMTTTMMITSARSAKKCRVSGPAVHTVWQQLKTSCALPPAGSNGARLVSGKSETNHFMARGQDGKISCKYS